MSEATKWAISQGVELELRNCEPDTHLAIIVVHPPMGGKAIMMLEKILKSEITDKLDAKIAEMVELVREIAGIRPYVIETGFRHN